MACIKKLEQNVTFDCAKAVEPVSMRGIEELILVNYDDISNYSVDNAGLATITMKQGKKGYTVASVGNSVSATIAARANDIIPTAQEHSIIIKLITNSGAIGTSEFSALIYALQQGSYIACVLTASNKYFVYGLLSGLECSEIAGDSATDGIISVTLKTPDAAGGDRLLAITEGAYGGLKIPKA